MTRDFGILGLADDHVPDVGVQMGGYELDYKLLEIHLKNLSAA